MQVRDALTNERIEFGRALHERRSLVNTCVLQVQHRERRTRLAEVRHTRELANDKVGERLALAWEHHRLGNHHHVLKYKHIPELDILVASRLKQRQDTQQLAWWIHSQVQRHFRWQARQHMPQWAWECLVPAH